MSFVLVEFLCSFLQVLFQESQVVPAFMLTIDPDDIPSLFNYYKNTLRPSSSSNTSFAPFSDDSEDGLSSDSCSTIAVKRTTGLFESADYARFRVDRESERNVQLANLV
jgi:hypothetical protein